jgi:hypothetical protein
MDSIEYLNDKDRGSESPVPITIVRACEGVRRKAEFKIEEADLILEKITLEKYIYTLII